MPTDTPDNIEHILYNAAMTAQNARDAAIRASWPIIRDARAARREADERIAAQADKVRDARTAYSRTLAAYDAIRGDEKSPRELTRAEPRNDDDD